MQKFKGVFREGVRERNIGYSDYQMYRQCSLYFGVMNKTKTVKVGRGKNAIFKEEKIYIENAETEKLNLHSLEHYKNLMTKPSKIKFRDYQKKIIVQGSELLILNNFLYLTMEVRTGKTLTSLGIAQLLNSKNVLFVTKKRAISSIENDFTLLRPDFDLTVINYESLHKVEDVGDFDLVVCDEAHCMGAFPKPNRNSRYIKEVIKHNPYVILLSGTPTPESYSQMYHQVWGIKNNPFKEYSNFYKFAKRFIKLSQLKINGMMINTYKDGLIDILSEMNKYTISYTQKEAGFKVDTKEHILNVRMKDKTYDIAKRLKKDLVIEGKEETILADTSVKLMMKLHQIYSGTIKFESGKSMIIDLSKAEFINDNFYDKKIGIFYKFKQELAAIKEVYKDNICTDLDTFKNTDKSIALQIISGREGISLKQAEALVYYNIDFSATSYWQSRDRMTTKERLKSDVYWIFSEGGMEKDIYKAVIKKKDYTINHFKKDYAIY